MSFAAQDGRVVISHNVNTMTAHFTAFLTDGHQSAGLIFVSQLIGINDAIEAIHLIWQASDAAEWIDRIDFLPWT